LGLAQQIYQQKDIEKAIEILFRVQEEVSKLPPSEKKCRLFIGLANGFYDCFQFDLIPQIINEYFSCVLQLKDQEQSIAFLFRLLEPLASFQKHPQRPIFFAETVQTIRNLIHEKSLSEQVLTLARLGKILIRLEQLDTGEATLFESFSLLENFKKGAIEDADSLIATLLEEAMYEVISTKNTPLIQRIIEHLSQHYTENFFSGDYGYPQKYRALVFSCFGEAYYRIQEKERSQHFIQLALKNLKEIEGFDFAGEAYILLCKKFLDIEEKAHSEYTLMRSITFIRKIPDERRRMELLLDFARLLTGLQNKVIAIQRISSLVSIASSIYNPDLRAKGMAVLAQTLCEIDSLDLAQQLFASDNPSKSLFLPEYILALGRTRPPEALHLLKYLTTPFQRWEVIRKLATHFAEKKNKDFLKKLVILSLEDHETIDFVFYKLLQTLDDPHIFQELKEKYLNE
jgi:hypothetical protein